MAEERLFETELSEEEYDQLQDKYITIPPGKSGIAQEGDTTMEVVEAGIADWKNPGRSLAVPLTVVSEGINKGKTIDWYAGVEADAMTITKKALRAFGIESRVIRRVDGKIRINPSGFAGARARALFRREMSNKGNLRSVLDSTGFLPVDATSQTKDLGI